MELQVTPIVTPTRVIPGLSLDDTFSDPFSPFNLTSSIRTSSYNFTTYSLPNTPITQKILPPPSTPLPKRTRSSPASIPPRHKRQRSIKDIPEASSTENSPSTSHHKALPVSTFTTPTRIATGLGSSSTSSPSSINLRPASTNLNPQHLQHQSIDDTQGDREESPDPLAPRASYYEDGYITSPVLRYHTKSNKAAESEFEDVVLPTLVLFMESRHYTSFLVHLVHVGFEEQTAVPCVIVCGSCLSTEHGEEIMSHFASLQCQHVMRVFCFRGDTTMSTHSTDYMWVESFRRYQDSPILGSSISVAGSPSSFSLGLYVHFEDSDEQLCLTVHHGISESPAPITDKTSPTVVLQQPSFKDTKDAEETLREDLAMIMAGSKCHQNLSRTNIEKDLEQLLSTDRTFGQVLVSEMTTVTYNGNTMNSDWALVKVDGRRSPSNIFQTFLRPFERYRWLPRDVSGNMYVQGPGDIQLGSSVLKSGRRTGITEGRVSFVYPKARLGAITTSEYTVVSNPNKLFSDKDDSGGPVINEVGEIVGIIIGGTEGEPLSLEGHEQLGKVIVSYITPIHLIINRIESQTGRRVLIDIPGLEKLAAEGVEFVG